MSLRIKKVLLVTPPYHCGMVESAGVWMPLGLAYLAGSLEKSGFEVEIFDAMSYFLELAEIRAHIEHAQPDAVAVTAFTASTHAATDVAAAAKDAVPGVITILGGVHPTHMAHEVLVDRTVDYVVRGEGEYALVDLLKCINAGDSVNKVDGISFVDRSSARAVSTPSRPLISNLDELDIAWHLIDWPIYHYRTEPGSRPAITSWSRGCTKACVFCSQQKMWRCTWRPRGVESIISELRQLKERYGVDTVELADEHPTHEGARWEQILDRLIEEDLGIELLIETRADDICRDAPILNKYVEAGILHTYVGTEAPQQDRLDAMNKDLLVEESKTAIKLLNDHGVITETSFLLGLPGDTIETIENTLELAIEYDPDLAFFLAVTPWPYSDLYGSVADKVEVTDLRRYNLINPIIKPDTMTRRELEERLSSCFMKFYKNKMRTIHQMAPAKRDYMMKVAKLLMTESLDNISELDHPSRLESVA